MIHLEWSSPAELDIVEIYAKIYVHNPSAAERTITDIERKITLLNRHPKIGVNRPDIRPNIRMLSSPPYQIFYVHTLDEEDVEHINIFRILDCRRDLADLL